MSQSPVLTGRDEIAKLQEEYAKNPEGRLFVHLAEAYRKAGELERARDLLLQGLQNHSDYVSAHLVLAEVQRELGEAEAAQSSFETVLDLDGENEVALRGLAELAESAGRTDDAIAHFELLLEIGGEDDEVQARLARLRGEEVTPDSEAETVNQKESVSEESESERETAPSPRAPEPQEAKEEERSGGEVRRGEPRAAAREGVRSQAQQRREAAAPQTDAIGIADLLVRLLEYRDSTFHAESSLTRVLALAIGRELELERIHLDSLALAALLSDIAGTSLDGRERLRPVQGDEDEQRRRAQREVALSLQLLDGLTLPAGVHEAVRHQHERWDGTGYPDGLRDEEIPYTARVLAIARAAAETLTSRAAGRARTVSGALDELQRQAGSHYDPVVINVLRRVFQRRAEHGIGYGLGGHLMLVHTEELRVLGLATQLHASGYEAEMAHETGRVRERLRSTSTRALVLGASLPGSDVARFVREVRGNAGGSALPIIVIDANEMEQRVELLTAGADVCFPSEVSFREFKATLDSLLRRTEEGGGAEIGTRADALG